MIFLLRRYGFQGGAFTEASTERPSLLQPGDYVGMKALILHGEMWGGQSTAQFLLGIVVKRVFREANTLFFQYAASVLSDTSFPPSCSTRNSPLLKKKKKALK